MNGEQARILIVDDQPENLVALEALLADFGADVIRANSGREALKLLLEMEFALILLDIQMPDLDGFETAKMIRNRENTKHIPIIFLTAMYTEDMYEAEAYALGAVDFMTKPFPPHVLRSKVNFFVDLYRKNQHIQRQSALILEMDRRRLEEAREKLVVEKQLIQEELLRKQKEAELLEERSQQLQKADRLKDEFLANMSHEIRTPMNAVIGFSELLLGTELSSEQNDYADRIKESAQGLLTLINDILDLSKIAAGKLDLEPLDFELVPLVEGTSAVLSESAKEKDLGLMTFIDPALPTFVNGDPGRLRQILLNLIGNAIKFTSKGEIVIEVTMIGGAEEGSDQETTLHLEKEVQVKFSISDTGIGLTEEEIGRLFRPFTQADGSTTRKFGGTGLGLSISKRLVELMNGEIGVESKPGKGSTFWFTIPFEVVTQIRKIYPVNDLESTKILVIDNHVTSKTILKTYIQSWSMQCDTADGIEEAVRQLRDAVKAEEPYDIVISDLNLPEGDAFLLLRRIKQEQRIANTRVILCTAQDQRGLGEKALHSGFSAFLTKPLEQSRLFNCIARIMSSLKIAFDENSLEQTRQILQGPTILLAEDNPVNQKVTMLQLRKLGFNCVAVWNGQQAVDALQSAAYHAVLMDCQMPEMDGLQATREIRKAEALTGAHVPIIGLTAHAMGGDRERCIAAGMDDYLSKPVSLERLQQALLKWVARNNHVLMPGN